jgi:hypothetical protein
MREVYRVGILLQNFVITRYTDKEYTSRGILEAMYPFASFRPLPSDITYSNVKRVIKVNHTYTIVDPVAALFP